MENRFSDRLRTSLKVTLLSDKLPVACGVIRNLCDDGVFIQSRLLGVVVGKRLEVELLSHDCRNTELLKSRRFSIVIMHSNEEGFGAKIEASFAQKYHSLLRRSAFYPGQMARSFQSISFR
jgi:hypothetical protein